MSQTKHKTPEFLEFNGIRSMSFELVFYSLTLSCLAGMFIIAANNAQASVMASVTTHTKIDKNPTYVLKTNLDTMANRDNVILDWRTQEFELAFDLPANDLYESLDLFLSAYPEGQVVRGTPLLISYNGAKPVSIYGRGSRFDVHIRMDTSRIRLSGNSIKISYQIPKNADCLTPGNGQWVLDLSHSKLVAKARTKKRTMQISEIEQRLAHAMTAPKRVGITAKGSNKLAYEALATQGIAQRMSFVPELKLGNGLSDMQFIIGTHNDIRPLLNNKSILSAPGARVVIDNGHKPKVVLTAETEVQLLKLVRAFATYPLPTARRESVLLHEFYSGTKFKPHALVAAGKYKLSDIGTPILTPSWRPKPAVMNFNLADPYSTSGVLILKILSSKNLNAKSSLSVKLNDKSIGFTHLNKTSKTVEFRIKPGMFKASDNEISITPDIQPATFATFSCQTQQHIPTIALSSTSKLHLTSSRPAPATELSRLAASGAPFTSNSTLVLTAKTVQDKQATLRFLGYSAQQFGPKWTDAEYLSALPAQDKLNKNILIIGPNPLSDPVLFMAAPTSLKLALSKTKVQRPNDRKTVNTDQFVSADSNKVFKIAARRNQATRLKSGGVAALFPSPYANDWMIGVISSDRPEKFGAAMKSVTNHDYWNSLQGSVARWDKSTILMAQTALPLSASFGLSKTAPATSTPKFVSIAKSWFTPLSVRKPRQAEPEQATSNNPQIGVARVVAQPRKLPGALPPRPEIRKVTPMRKWWKDITHNPTVFFLLIMFFGFFFVAILSPMTVFRKKD